MDFIENLTDIVGVDNITASPVDCLAYSETCPSMQAYLRLSCSRAIPNK